MAHSSCHTIDSPLMMACRHPELEIEDAWGMPGKEESTGEIKHKPDNLQIQSSVIRDQLSASSRDMVGIRQELRNLQLNEAKLRSELGVEEQERQELTIRLDGAKNAASDALVLSKNLQLEISEEREIRERLGRDLVTTEERLNRVAEERLSRVAEELRHQQEILSDALDAERRERAAAFERCRARAAELTFLLDEEHSQRITAFEGLGHEVHRLWLAVEEEAKKRIASISELTSAQETETKERVALEVSVHQALQVMHGDYELEMQERAKLTSSGKEMLQTLDQERLDRISDMQIVTDSLNKLADDFKEGMDTVSRDRCVGHDQLSNSTEFGKDLLQKDQHLRTSIERLERETRAAVEESSHRVLELSNAAGQERSHRERIEAELVGYRQELQLERKERMEEDAFLLRQVDGERDARGQEIRKLADRALEPNETGMKCGEDVVALAREMQVIKESVAKNLHALTLLGSSFDAEAFQRACEQLQMDSRNYAKELHELSDWVRHLWDALNQEVELRKAGVKEALDAVGLERQDRIQDFEYARNDPNQNLTDAFLQEVELRKASVQEILQAIKAERQERIDDLASLRRNPSQEIHGLRAQLANCLREILNERNERTSEVNLLRQSTQALESEVTKHLRDLQQTLELKFARVEVARPQGISKYAVARETPSVSSTFVADSPDSCPKPELDLSPHSWRNFRRGAREQRTSWSPVAAGCMKVAAECVQLAAAADSTVLKRVKSEPSVAVDLGTLERVRMEMEAECNDRARAVQHLAKNLQALSGELRVPSNSGSREHGTHRLVLLGEAE